MKIGRKYGEKEKIQILIKSLIFCILRIYIFSFYAFLFFRSLAHAKHSDNPSDDCAICKYSLSLFTEPQPVEFHCTLTLVPYEPVIYQDKVVCKRTYSHHLRGPPVA